MASYEFELAPPPEPARDRELWLMHAAGLILFEDVGKYARGEIAPASIRWHARPLKRQSMMRSMG